MTNRETLPAKEVRTVLGRHILTDAFKTVIDLEKSHGSWIVDAVSGKEYLDLFSMFATMTVGYNHPFLLKNKDRLANAAVNKPTLSDMYTIEYAEFMGTFDEVGIPDYLPYAFFIEGGTLAVENAMKTAFDWKVQKNLDAGRGEKGSQVIHFERCFHGRSGYTLSMTDSYDTRKTRYFPKFHWPRVTHPHLRFPVTEAVIKEVEKLEQQAIAEIKKAIYENPHDIAAIIIEPIQGEGGDNHIRPEFTRQLRAICDEEDIILIYDEVQTGVGITGAFWCHEHFGEDSRPDILAFGKKTQVCGILASRRLDEVPENVFNEASRINSTWGGNLVDMVRFNLILQIVRNEGLVNKAGTQGEYLLTKIQGLAEEFPGFVTNPRGRGLFAAIDLPSQTERSNVRSALYENGIIMLGCGERSLRFRPHLNITQEEIDLAYDLLHKSIKSCLA
jgi:L-lysine 6-transaminase